MTAAQVLGVPDKVIVNGCMQVAGVPGRFQSVSNDDGIGVVVDYAHTPESLEGVLRSARRLTDARIIVVFGCGGDRDAGKRSVMGEIASRLSDVVFITSDNPRSEDSAAIRAMAARASPCPPVAKTMSSPRGTPMASFMCTVSGKS